MRTKRPAEIAHVPNTFDRKRAAWVMCASQKDRLFSLSLYPFADSLSFIERWLGEVMVGGATHDGQSPRMRWTSSMGGQPMANWQTSLACALHESSAAPVRRDRALATNRGNC